MYVALPYVDHHQGHWSLIVKSTSSTCLLCELCIDGVQSYTCTVYHVQEIGLAGVENTMAQTLLEASDVSSRLKYFQQFQEEQSSMLQAQNDLISRSEAVIARNNGLIERKQTQIDQMNKKIEQQISKLGGV